MVGDREPFFCVYLFACMDSSCPYLNLLPLFLTDVLVVDVEMNGEFLQGMTKMVLEYASRRLADALFMEDLGVDLSSLISATKFIILELEEVSKHNHAIIMQ
jgi:hypothetical protein